MSETGRQRLTSWKEIAAHVGRDVRTVLRWEKERGLPVHRVPGAKGRVVFAYTDELDAWAHGQDAAGASNAPVTTPVNPLVPDGATLSPTATHAVRRPSWQRIAVTAAMAAAAIAAAAWGVTEWKSASTPFELAMTDSAIIATNQDGAERWRHGFPAGEKVVPVTGRSLQLGEPAGRDIVIATSYSERGSDSQTRSGELMRFTRRGKLTNVFSFDDQLRFGSGNYGPAWGITDFRVHATSSGYRTALAAHHLEWWPSIVTILDESWTRIGTFVNAGWVERVHWISDDRLAIAGFANEQDGGMIALLDGRAPAGQSPTMKPEFRCTSCGVSGPLRYIVLPRSEVNRASGSPFNRVVLIVKPDRLIARTIEMQVTAAAPDALYEFTINLDLIRASYSDRYWDKHRELEASGKIAHTREQCPDRDGPKHILVWEPESGWATMPTTAARGRNHP